jgi:deazaflavin-dependent oxidoreductase (nitroreductase family)
MFSRAVAAFTHHAARLPVVGPLFGRVHAWVFRRTRGRVGRSWLGAPVLVLETVGRRSGARRETALLYIEVAPSGLAVVGANAGNDAPPAWWLNLCAAETVVVVVGGERRTMRWRLAEDTERARLLAEFMEVYPPARAYQGYTARPLPVAVLTPA